MDAFTEPTAELGRVPVAYGERWPEGELIEALYREAYGPGGLAEAGEHWGAGVHWARCCCCDCQ